VPPAPNMVPRDQVRWSPVCQQQAWLCSRTLSWQDACITPAVQPPHASASHPHTPECHQHVRAVSAPLPCDLSHCDVCAAAPTDAGVSPALCAPPPSQVVLPLELNTRVRGRWKDGEFYRCKILERRTLPEFNTAGAQADPAGAYEYYVHFSGSEWQQTPHSSQQCRLSPHTNIAGVSQQLACVWWGHTHTQAVTAHTLGMCPQFVCFQCPADPWLPTYVPLFQ
jgi:hypothetical protein